MKSIRRRLLIILLIMIGGGLIIGCFGVWKAAREESGEALDYQMREMSIALYNGNFSEIGDQQAFDPEENSNTAVQIISTLTKQLVYQSRPDISLPVVNTEGYQTVIIDGEPWRLYMIRKPNRLYEVAQPMSSRANMASEFALQATLPFLFLFPMMGGIIWLILSHEFKPLTRMAEWVNQRQPEDLAHYPEQNSPQELKPLVNAINELQDRLGQALTQQQVFIADASHELRTPLTALTLQIQLLEAARSAEEQQQAIHDLIAGVQRAHHLTEQLLVLARHETGGKPRYYSPIELTTLLKDVLCQHATLAHNRQIDMGLADSTPEAIIHGDPHSLSIMLSNLLSNALRYTPIGGRIDLASGRETDVCWISVSDTGPGIPEEEQNRIFDRFYRIPGTSGNGSGLGLAIVKAIADQHHAVIRLGQATYGGLCVRIEFPGYLNR